MREENKLILGEDGTRLIQGSTIEDTLQKLNKEAYEKRKLAPVTELLMMIGEWLG